MNLTSWLFSSLSVVLQQYSDLYMETDFRTSLKKLEKDFGLPRIKEYDFIIGGAGVAGSLLAERLSQHFTVLLLEAGGNPVPHTYNSYLIKKETATLCTHPAYHDIYRLTKQKNFQLDQDGVYHLYTGRMMGGSGSHNGYVYNRCSPHDYDTIANMTGDQDWKYENIVEHFKSFETHVGHLVNEEHRTVYYKNVGPFRVKSDNNAILDKWLKAGKELGYEAGDPNGYQKESFTPFVWTKEDGIRISSYTAFIKPIEQSREKLTVLRYSVVDKVLINNDKKAYGVAYERHGIPQIAHARKEVIISAGTLASPLILLKSGIGPKSVLEDANIPVVHDSPGVGDNLQDHTNLFILFEAKNKSAFEFLYPRIHNEIELQEHLKRYHEDKGNTHIFDYTFGPQSFIKTKFAKNEWPDIAVVQQQNKNLYEDYRIAFEVALMRPISKGRIVFNTTALKNGKRKQTEIGNPDLNYFGLERDVEAVIEGIDVSLKLSKTKAYADYQLEYVPNLPEACANLVAFTKEYWTCIIKRKAASTNHLVGTCKIGPDNDPKAVVDPKFRVRGVKGLRVVDASVFPIVPNANTMGPTMAGAEKASRDIIKEYVKAEGGPPSEG